MTEQPTTSRTGGNKNRKLAQAHLAPTKALTELFAHYGRGEAKYPTGEDRVPNYRRGYDWSLSYDAAQRHLMAFWSGEDRDAETGSKHVIAAAWHCLALASFMDDHPGFDDRTEPRMAR